MSEHLQKFSSELESNRKIAIPFEESSKSRVIGKLRYWWCWFVVGVMVLFVAPALIVWYRFKKDRSRFYKWCDWGARVWLKACGAKVRVTGLENLNDDRDYVFVSNHRSYLDTASLYVYAGKRIGLVAKKELLKVPIFGYGMAIANVFAIDRSNPERARKSIDRARELIEKGFSFGVFAEGTRAMPGELLPFKKGAIHLALQAKAPIAPVAFRNTDELMGKRRGVAYAGTVEMVILPTIETEGKNAKDDLMPLLNEVRTAIAGELFKGS
ncbi:MAG: 1-acyl-sn-glycerol-3-phosphate acyltransferase [Aridibacter famidurans]|nr:1-acyl-sn-glycerol-3-phosphate acyltransferase [Aridibacter famidurans]